MDAQTSITSCRVTGLLVLRVHLLTDVAGGVLALLLCRRREVWQLV